MSLTVQVLNKLAHDIGPRPPGSLQEEEAARYLHDFFLNRNLDSKVETFHSIRTFSLTYSFFYIVSICSVIIYPWIPWLSVILSALNVLMYILEINTWRNVSRLLSTKTSRNVIAGIAQGKSPLRSIVISAHLDSSRSGALFYPPLVYLFRSIFLGATISLVIIPILLFMALIFENSYIWLAALLPALILFGEVLLLLQREIAGGYTCGANKNASAVAVMAALADYYSRKPLQNCELWFVGTGSEESGAIGMTEFLRRYRKKLKKPLFINLESLGSGNLQYIEQEGMFPVRDADLTLTQIAREAATEYRLPFSPGRFRTMFTDNIPVLSRRLPGITLMGCGERELIPHWHQLSDTVENINHENLETSLDMVKAMLNKIDRLSQTGP
jgi:hypothetical protein